MIEILLMWFTAKFIREDFKSKGRETGAQWLVLLIPVGGFIVTFIVSFALGMWMALSGNEDFPVPLVALPAYLGTELLVVWALRSWAKKQPSLIGAPGLQSAYALGVASAAPYVPAAPVAAVAPAGFCTECNGPAWLTPQGGCVNGHPASCVFDSYMAPTGAQEPPRP